jgi:hypothetical protein
MSAMSPTTGRFCHQCGATASGTYCSNCGARLDEDVGLGAEIGAKLSEPLEAGFATLKTTWLVGLAPTRFFDAYFNATQPLDGLDFPLAPIWRIASKKPQHVLAPFKFLAVGLILAAFCDTVDGWIAALAPPEAHHDVTDPALGRWFEIQYGHKLHFMDLGHLTGIAGLDEPIHQILQVLYYSFAAVMIGCLLVGTRVPRRKYLHYHLYAVGAALVLRAAAFLASFALAALLAGISRILTRFVVDLVQLSFGFLPMIWFIAVLPILVFPRVLPVGRGRILAAVLGGLGLTGAFNWWSIQATLFGHGWLILW